MDVEEISCGTVNWI